MKKRTLAIILSMLLVVSAVVALAACKKTQEYTITFRDTAGKTLEVVTTVDGKATPSAKATTKTGYTLEGWYREVGADEDGKYTYTGLVDLATTVFTEDTELYAKWKRNLTAGEDEGYCIIGSIKGITDEWPNSGFDPTTAKEYEEGQLTHSDTIINLYYITLDVKALDSFKIKTSTDGWDDGEINGLSPLVDNGEVKLAAGVELPEGITKAYDLFTYTYDVDNNLSPKCDMNITINFYYNADESYADIIINSIDGDIVKVVEEVGYVIAGSMNKEGDNWKTFITAAEIEADSTLAQYVLTTEDKQTFTTTVTLKRNDSFQIKVNESGWTRGQYGAGAIESVEYAEDLDEAKKPNADASVAFSTTGDIVVKYDLTAIITLTANGGATSTNGKISIVITDIDPTEPVSVTELGMAVVGGGALSWAYPYPNVMEYDETTQKFSKTGVVIPLGTEFKVKVNDDDNWAGGEWGRGVLTATKAGDVELPEGMTEAIELFGGEDTDAKGNIKALRGMTITISLVNFDADAKTGEVQIIVTHIEELPEETHDMYFVGSFGGAWTDNYETATKLTKKGDSTLWVGKITLTEADYVEWNGVTGKAAIKVKNRVDDSDYSGGDAVVGGNIRLAAGDYYVTYNETDNVIAYEKMEYYVVGTLVDSEGNTVSYAVKEGVTPKMVAGEEGKVVATITITDVSDKGDYNWLGEGNICAIKVVYGTSLGVTDDCWYGSDYKIQTAGDYTVTFDLTAKTFTVVAASDAEA